MLRVFSLTLFSLLLCFCPSCTQVFGQKLQNVPGAFTRLSTSPTVIFIDNAVDVPLQGGHLQGVQCLEQEDGKKLLLSGSSADQAYLLQVDLSKRQSDRLIPLMESPFRHAGGIQVGEKYLVVGIEDNHAKTLAKVLLYPTQHDGLSLASPIITIDREGPPKRPTAGATGLLPWKEGYLVVVGNWDSRDWDFYEVDLEKNHHRLIHSFAAPKDWGHYQSINLLRDAKALYAVGFYGNQKEGRADLILLSKGNAFEPIMKKVQTKTFACRGGVDFQTAVGLQIDAAGKLHIWATQRDATARIAVNRFSEER